MPSKFQQAAFNKTVSGSKVTKPIEPINKKVNKRPTEPFLLEKN